MNTLNVLVLHSTRWLGIETVRDFSRSFGAFSKHRIRYLDLVAFRDNPRVVHFFDAVVVLYAVRIPFSSLSTHSLFELRQFRGLKAAFVQDEYERTKETWELLQWANFDVLFSSIGGKSVTDKIYPQNNPGQITIEHVLTGYFWPQPESLKPLTTPSQKSIHMVYRGRTLPSRYGKLGDWKRTVPMGVKAGAALLPLKMDIEIDDRKRLAGDRWIRFLESGKTTLILPGGSAVFDTDGRLEEKLLEPHTFGYEDDRAVISEYELDTYRGVIPPRVFESLMSGTCLVGLDGWYSGILKPNSHFIPLASDLSNLGEVLEKLQDDTLLDSTWSRAYEAVIGNPTFSYPAMIRQLDEVLEREFLSRGHRHATFRSGLGSANPPRTSDIEDLEKEFSAANIGFYTALLTFISKLVRVLLTKRIRRRLRRALFD